MARPIRLCPPAPHWPDAFAAEQQRIASAIEAQPGLAFGSDYRLSHIGSTAVPGLWAKPIIDMLLCVPTSAALDECVGLLKQLGYLCKGENGIVGRRYFVLPVGIAHWSAQPWSVNSAPVHTEDRSHHLHVFVKGHPASDSHLAVRDYLRAHPAAIARYNEVKHHALTQSQGQSDRYSAEKDPFVQQLVQDALAWAHLQGRL